MDTVEKVVYTIWSPMPNSRSYPNTKTATNAVIEHYDFDPINPISSTGSISINGHLKGNTIENMQPQR